MEALSSFLNYLKISGKSNLTIKGYKTDIKQFLSFMEGKSSNISEETFRDYLTYLENKFTPASINRKLCALKSYLSYLKYPNYFIKSLPTPERLPIFLNSEEINHLRKAPDSPSDKVMINLFLDTGLRIRELQSLNREQFNGLPTIRVIGKRDREREVFFRGETLALIGEFIGEKNDGPLLVNSQGKRLSLQSITKHVHQLAKKAGIKKHITPHIFRHSFASQLLAGGASLYLIQKLLGHRSINSTLIYTHSNSEDDRKAYEKALMKGG